MPMSRFSRVNTIWRKELIDALRDRRTLIAMVLVPMVLYPALMLGSLQALEIQVGYLVTDQYVVAVPDEEVRGWLRRLIDSDPARRHRIEGATAEELAQAARGGAKPGEAPPPPYGLEPGSRDLVRFGVMERPPSYRIVVLHDLERGVLEGTVHAAVRVQGKPPLPGEAGSTRVEILYDQSDIRSEIAAAGIQGILARAGQRMLAQRLAQLQLEPDFVTPIALQAHNIAPQERMAGSLLGQIVPLILILMTIVGAAYPAIDLTAGERERGTLETLMVAPVPPSDLILGKFIVVTLIGLMSAVLNLLSIGGTIWLGGVGSILTQGRDLVFPLRALPWVFLLLVPLAVLFSAALLAVCSFARSFKEAQNYILPVVLLALIPGVVGVLPGTRLAGPIVVMPVANVVVLARELFLGKFPTAAIILVLLSTSLYAAAAVALAARLFGQEAVLFADAGSVRTVFLRRFFKPRPAPSAATALLVVAIVYSLNFFLQQSVVGAATGGAAQLGAIAVILAVLYGLVPLLTTIYVRADVTHTFQLRRPPLAGWAAGACFGLSTWVLVPTWFAFQQHWLPMDPNVRAALEAQGEALGRLNPAVLVLYLALVPAFCEELFFRGFALSGLRTSLSAWWSLLIAALAFGLSHYMAQRLLVTVLLGLLLGLLVIRFGSIWPAVLAHLLHNSITVLAQHPSGLQPLLDSLGYLTDDGLPAMPWVVGAGVLLALGLTLCAVGTHRPGPARGAAVLAAPAAPTPPRGML